jgi:YesN/AraC family two-component response regulator
LELSLKVLLVNDEPEILEILKGFLESKKHTVTTASNGKQALDLVLTDNDFDIAFSDIKMPEMDGLTFLGKIRVSNPNLPVVLISDQGNLANSIRALKLGALDFILKPVNLKFFEEVIQKIDTVSASECETVSAQQSGVDLKLSLSCESQLQHIQKIISYFNKQTEDICVNFGLDGHQVAICLQECLTNAIIHGNFAVDSSLKEKDWTAFDSLIKKREDSPIYRNKKVTVLFQHTPKLMRFTVTDEGDGFDPANLPDPANPESWLKLSGRGILFIRSYMDEVHWNGCGNVIAMTKYLDQVTILPNS